MSHFWASDLSYDAVMFDFSGVLVPLDRIGEAAFANVLAKHQIDGTEYLQQFDRAWNRTDPHLTLSNLFLELLGTSEASSEAFKAFNDEYTRRTLTAPEVPGATPLLKRLHEASIPVGLVSYASKDVLERQLSVRGWTRYFSTVFSRERFVAPKPDPGCHRTATIALHASLNRALAVERSAVGMQSAAAAGLAVVHLGCPNEARCDAPAQFHVTDLNDVASEVLQLEAV